MEVNARKDDLMGIYKEIGDILDVDSAYKLFKELCGQQVCFPQRFYDLEYEKTLKKARLKFGVYEREYGETKYWNAPDYLFDWTEGEFM